jgi:uncharacterized membrane protein YbhN (UPF0104 family)
MGAGAISNAIYLKDQKDFSIAHYTSSLSVSLVLMLMTASFTGLLTTLYLCLALHPVRAELLLLFLFVFTGSLVLMFVKPPIAKSHNFIAQNLKNFQKGIYLLQKDKKTILSLTILKFAILIIAIIQTKIIFDSINYQIDFGVIILIVMSISSFTLITILPGNIGFTESLSGIVANLSGSSFAYGFIGAATGRMIQVIWIFFLGIPFLFYFAYKIGNNDEK